MSALVSSQSVAYIAEEYRQKGYEILMNPRSDQLPKEIGSYVPDFIASKGGEHVVVEVKRRKELSSKPELRIVADRIREIRGWRLDLALLADDLPVPDFKPLAPEEIKQRLSAAQRLANETGDIEGAFLLIWTALESSLRTQLEEEGKRSFSPRQLVKFSYSIGLLSEEELKFLEEAADLRDEIVHGMKPSTHSTDAILARANQIAERLIQAPEELSEV